MLDIMYLDIKRFGPRAGAKGTLTSPAVTWMGKMGPSDTTSTQRGDD
jgi:hypothetical protein